MPASDFTIIPSFVEPVLPSFSTSISVAEDLSKDYECIEEEGYNRFKFTFDGISDSEHKTIRDHFISVVGETNTFLWKNSAIPSYIKSLLGITISDLTGRWVSGSFSTKISPRSVTIEILFERDVS